MPLPIILAGAAALTPTILNIGAKVGKFYSKTGSFGTAATFGLGYGGATNVGYNLSNAYITPGFKRGNAFTSGRSYNIQMPYNRSYNRRYSPRYSRYPARRSRYGYRRRPYYPRRY